MTCFWSAADDLEAGSRLWLMIEIAGYLGTKLEPISLSFISMITCNVRFYWVVSKYMPVSAIQLQDEIVTMMLD